MTSPAEGVMAEGADAEGRTRQMNPDSNHIVLSSLEERTQISLTSESSPTTQFILPLIMLFDISLVHLSATQNSITVFFFTAWKSLFDFPLIFMILWKRISHGGLKTLSNYRLQIAIFRYITFTLFQISSTVLS